MNSITYIDSKINVRLPTFTGALLPQLILKYPCHGIASFNMYLSTIELNRIVRMFEDKIEL